MKFRIVTNGKTFRIRRSKLFGWEWLGDHESPEGSTTIIPYEFRSAVVAVAHIHRKFGEDARIDEAWIPAVLPASENAITPEPSDEVAELNKWRSDSCAAFDEIMRHLDAGMWWNFDSVVAAVKDAIPAASASERGEAPADPPQAPNQCPHHGANGHPDCPECLDHLPTPTPQPERKA